MGSKRPRIMVTEAEYRTIIDLWCLYEMDDMAQENEAKYRADMERMQRLQDRWLKAAGS